MSQNPFRFFSPRDAGYTPGFENHAIDLTDIATIEYCDTDIDFLGGFGMMLDYISITGEQAVALLDAAKNQLANYRAWAPPCDESEPPNRATLTGSVRVMVSHDYCHFEINLGSTEPTTLKGVDSLRKEAARLADKAVEQYKKKKDALTMEDSYTTRDLRAFAKDIRQRPESEWTPEEKATMKELADREHAARYDYEDNPEDDQALDRPLEPKANALGIRTQLDDPIVLNPPVPAPLPADPDFEVVDSDKDVPL